MKYTVGTLRSAGLEAHWGRNRHGAPMLFARNPNATLSHQRDTWWAVDDRMWKQAERIGVLKAFDNATLLGNFFSIPA